ncbi:photosynthetic complex putative assembly protein PuhB [Erythrobacter sp. BLCC-B19]|uniref:photosynthetic complex putative assembly protein PuhB n=1 Tax=Erythrobacter sp. BLCC-B19 TaxID=3025315 RepID=UPI00235F039D|nr:photosynthetic complex putative assembly protein PuhB [Erythrobacter sp. BLCC-B19]WDA41570.1 photosynthetic complex putative assembly protein PuhB [Erythrobacter sp. BLCC-B19]
MDLNDPAGLTNPVAAAATPLPDGLDHAALENDGPKAFGDRMGTPAANEKVLWKGRPAIGLLARTAFHAHKLGFYMAALAVIAVAIGNETAAIVAAGLGVVLVALLYALAWASARSTLYILTDTRLIMRIGMAIETRINVPLKQVTAANLRLHGKSGFGDIAFDLAGERMLGVALLWPHVRPWHYARPQPMLRAVPEAASLAQLIAATRAQYGAIARNLTEIKEATPASGHTEPQVAGSSGRIAPSRHLGDAGLEGAPA